MSEITTTTYVGIDLHKEKMVIAILAAGQKPETINRENRRRGINSLIKLLKKYESVRVCYEAGPLGWGVQRMLRAAGIDCIVIAPSLIPRRPGDRIKTDRRDALKLAKHLRSGELTEVFPPTPEEEGLKDLCRGRDDARGALTTARNQLSSLLLRYGIRYDEGKTNWTQRHRSWLRRTIKDAASWPTESARLTAREYLAAVESAEGALERFETLMREAAKAAPFQERVGRLKCFRGIDDITAISLVAELHGIERFLTAPQLMAFVGLVPREDSTGFKRRVGSITKTGNSRVRRLLVEAAWHYRHRPAVGANLRKRREGQSPLIIEMADKAQKRLCKRWYRLSERMPRPKATVAIARELAGCVWAALRPEIP